MSHFSIQDIPHHPGDFIRTIRQYPEALHPLLMAKDLRIERLFKKRKTRALALDSGTSGNDAIREFMKDPLLRFNKQTWLSFKSALMHSREDLSSITGCRFRKSYSHKSVCAKVPGDFLLWLLQNAGISPHHCRQMVRYDQNVYNYFGMEMSERTPCDVIDVMHNLLMRKAGGTKVIFNLSRLWWIYRENREEAASMAKILIRLTQPEE